MLSAFLLLASAANLVPMRWASSDPNTLALLKDTPVNCLLVEKPSKEFIAAAKAANITTLAVVRPGDTVPGGDVVFEGDFEALPNAAGLAIHLPSRARMRFDAEPVVGTYQGVWPGIQVDDGEKAHAAPSGAPWIHTNGGFLRFVHAAAPGRPVWIANTPPKGQVFSAERYMQAIADAAIVGARWVIALDDDLSKRLFTGDARALAEWKKIAALASWFEAHPEWKDMRPMSQLAVIQDVDSGALLSGGVLDMIAVKHTPVLPVPARQLAPEKMAGAQMAVNVSPSTLTAEQKEALRDFARKGGTTLSGPATWTFPPLKPDRITLGEEDVKTLDEIWKDTNSMTGRRNLGARLFNVSSMLSNLGRVGETAVLHLVNYSGYPVENVTVHLLGKYKSARLLSPGKPDAKLQPYEIEEGTGVDIDTIGIAATLVLE
jgi:hypothetical protein